ncbi:DKNYY domain-containing protein [Acinetobacter pittii]|uniref:DKNYY domain-containing protein n=1 Tax=Acinetobacter pittii TaxID=48296 RepID=UPI001950CFDE|nr:DKNYY domain-containing protein [Acinetobacter pittii]QRQ11533.1 DKNYY domain-containing protein [Acinetobacter pittii]
MIKISLIIILVFVLTNSLSSTTACEPSPPPVYQIQNNAVYFHERSWDDTDKQLMVSRDIKNFKIINALYAKDSVAVYYLGNVLQGADPASFKFLGGLEGVGTKDGYSKDAHHVYFLGKSIAEADPNSFKLFENTEAFARDKQHVYFKRDILKQLNTATTKSLGNGYWSELHKLYYFSNNDNSRESILTLISDQFDGKYKQFDDYFLSAQGIFKKGEKTSFDPSSFQVLARKDIGNTCFPQVVATLISDKHGTWQGDKKLKIHLRVVNGYTNIFESDTQELYVFLRDDGLKNLGLKSQLTLINSDDGILIQSGKNTYLLDQYSLRDISGSIPAHTKLSIYAPLDGTLILIGGEQLYIFDGSLHPISEDMLRLIYIDDDSAVFEDKVDEILNVSHGSVMTNNPKHSNSYPFDVSGMKFIRYSKMLADLMKLKNIELEPDQGMFLVKKYITFADGSPVIQINERQYEQLLKYVVSDAEWEIIRKEKVRLYLSQLAQEK